MATQIKHPTSATRNGLIPTLRRYWKENEWLYLIVGICIGALLPFLFQNLQAEHINAFINSLVPEAVGIFFTVIIIDRLDSIREEQVIKDQLVRRLQSRYNHTALQAIEEMRVLGYLEDGTLRKRNLRGSNWVDGNMYMADLRESDLGNANLSNADFVLANLDGVNVSDEQLAMTHIMHGATMPDGRKYDGRYNLEGDFAYARRKHIDVHNEYDMAKWYGVPLEQYREGQRWADHHLSTLGLQ